jgi:hypothetical protein
MELEYAPFTFLASKINVDNSRPIKKLVSGFLTAPFFLFARQCDGPLRDSPTSSRLLKKILERRLEATLIQARRSERMIDSKQQAI